MLTVICIYFKKTFFFDKVRGCENLVRSSLGCELSKSLNLFEKAFLVQEEIFPGVWAISDHFLEKFPGNSSVFCGDLRADRARKRWQSRSQKEGITYLFTQSRLELTKYMHSNLEYFSSLAQNIFG